MQSAKPPPDGPACLPSGVPSPAASRLRLPPAVRPAARPGTSASVPSQASARASGWPGSNRARRRSRCARGNVVNEPPPTFGACRVGTPSRRANASCSAVMSLNPVKIFGGAAAIAAQSSRSAMRCAPYPPRAHSTASIRGSSQARCRSAARLASDPAR